MIMCEEKLPHLAVFLCVKHTADREKGNGLDVTWQLITMLIIFDLQIIMYAGENVSTQVRRLIDMEYP